jgi:hypothetical protein
MLTRLDIQEVYEMEKFTRRLSMAFVVAIVLCTSTATAVFAGDIGPGPDSTHHVVLGR